MLRTHFSFVDDERTRRVNHKGSPPALDADVYLEDSSTVVQDLEVSSRRKLLCIKNRLTLDDGTFATTIELRASGSPVYTLRLPTGDAGFAIPVDANVDSVAVVGNGTEPGKVRVIEL